MTWIKAQFVTGMELGSQEKSVTVFRAQSVTRIRAQSTTRVRTQSGASCVVVQLLSRVQLFVTLWPAGTPGFPILHHLPEFA